MEGSVREASSFNLGLHIQSPLSSFPYSTLLTDIESQAQLLTMCAYLTTLEIDFPVSDGHVYQILHRTGEEEGPEKVTSRAKMLSCPEKPKSAAGLRIESQLMTEMPHVSSM